MNKYYLRIKEGCACSLNYPPYGDTMYMYTMYDERDSPLYQEYFL